MLIQQIAGAIAARLLDDALGFAAAKSGAIGVSLLRRLLLLGALLEAS
jgi:hypothetical protein